MAPTSEPSLLGLALRCDPRAPRLARTAVKEALDSATVAEDATLVTSELVSHAVLHSGCAADDMIRVAAHLDDGFLIVSVHHPVVTFQPDEPGDSRIDPEAGKFGLAVVAHLADRCGTEHPDGHRIWAALAIDPADDFWREPARLSIV